ncbi:hypothetical protein LZ30DRAFT_406751 [Colletotrichum cereale]|nr:hypothetical protein LZ30DRAFT_406751 [Colletotrichum cereale]
MVEARLRTNKGRSVRFVGVMDDAASKAWFGTRQGVTPSQVALLPSCRAVSWRTLCAMLESDPTNPQPCRAFSFLPCSNTRHAEVLQIYNVKSGRISPPILGRWASGLATTSQERESLTFCPSCCPGGCLHQWNTLSAAYHCRRKSSDWDMFVSVTERRKSRGGAPPTAFRGRVGRYGPKWVSTGPYPAEPPHSRQKLTCRSSPPPPPRGTKTWSLHLRYFICIRKLNCTLPSSVLKRDNFSGLGSLAIQIRPAITRVSASSALLLAVGRISKSRIKYHLDFRSDSSLSPPNP